MYIFKLSQCLASIQIAYGWCYVLAVCATVNEKGLLYSPTVKSKVTLGVIICDVETDMASHHTHSQIHIPTFMHGHMVPGAQMYDSHYVCVFVCVY